MDHVVTDEWTIRHELDSDITKIMAGENEVACFQPGYRAYAERLVKWYNGEQF